MKITKVTPWLLLATAAYNFGRQGEYIFVEVQTDEGINGWGEVTTTHPVANRAVCAVLQQLDPLVVGENPFHIEKLWNKGCGCSSEWGFAPCWQSTFMPRIGTWLGQMHRGLKTCTISLEVLT